MKLLTSFTIALVSIGTLGTAIAEPPASSGIVMRDGYFFGSVEVDTDAGVLAVLGFDPIEYCADPDNAAFDFVTFSDKNLQNGFRLNTLEKGEMTASVWPLTEFQCDLIALSAPLATGIVKYRLHDNDLFGPEFCDQKNNANAFGMKANGTLYTIFGEAMKLNMHVWGLFDCETFSFPLFKTTIKLTE